MPWGELHEKFAQYTREINRLRAESTANHDGAKIWLVTLTRQIDNIVDAVAAGQASPALLGRLEKLELEKEDLKNRLAGPAPDPVRFHPNVAELYVLKVNGLRNALNEDGTREEAAQILRGLVDEIRLHPVDDQLQIELIGDLATLLSFAEKKGADNKKPGSSVTADSPDAGSAREELEVEYRDDAIEIGFNARYLLDITQQVAGDDVEVALADPASPTLVRDADDASALYVLMPMRV